MNSIIYDDKIITPKDNKWGYYLKFTEKLSKRDCVKFALFCAKSVNDNTKESNDCIELVEQWLIDEKSVSSEELSNVAASAVWTAYAAADAAASVDTAAWAAYAARAAYYAVNDNINKYLQILLRKTKQFSNNKIIQEIIRTDVDKLEEVDWNMITDIIAEEYNIIHEFIYEDIFSRRCLIELLRREYS